MADLYGLTEQEIQEFEVPRDILMKFMSCIPAKENAFDPPTGVLKGLSKK